MALKYFGTDGIRGKAYSHPITAEFAERFAQAVAAKFRRASGVPSVIIGKDTRESGDMLEAALSAGFESAGYTVKPAGIIPTPAVAMLTKQTDANVGVMISASHNLYRDNGLKLFGSDGTKLSDADEQEIEQLIDNMAGSNDSSPHNAGTIEPFPDAAASYASALLEASGTPDLTGMKIVLDCAHGAAVTTAPKILDDLGATLTLIGDAPDGLNINAGVGSTATSALKSTVIDTGADIGIALDGDADRLIIVDETGEEIDGDQIIALIARHMHDMGALKGGGVVATVMSNMGLDLYLKTLGLTLARTPVGDRHVAAYMRQHGYNLGGEQSGHIILSDTSTTGDGLLAALQVLAVLKGSHQKMSALGKCFDPAPQELVNIRYSESNPLEEPTVTAALREAEAMISGTGRLVVRKSGTEPLIRVMAEGTDAAVMAKALETVVAAVKSAT